MSKPLWVHRRSLNELVQSAPLAESPAPRGMARHQPADWIPGSLALSAQHLFIVFKLCSAAQWPWWWDLHRTGVMVEVCLNPPTLWSWAVLRVRAVSTVGGCRTLRQAARSHYVCWAQEQSFNPTNNPCNKKHWFSFYLIRELFSPEHFAWLMSIYCSKYNCIVSTAQWEWDHLDLYCLLYIF